jgi:hypothetical protein
MILTRTRSLVRQYVSGFFPNYVDRQLALPSYWAAVELELNTDDKAARGVWESYTTQQGGVNAKLQPTSDKNASFESANL